MLDDGSRKIVEAASYEVDDQGGLSATIDGEVVATWQPGQWVAVEQLGTRLISDWPPPDLQDLLDDLTRILIVTYGRSANHLEDATKYASEVFNEVDSLAGAVLACAHTDLESTDRMDLPVIAAVRHHVADSFNRQVPPGGPIPSPRISSLRCTRCGDALHNERSALTCPTGKMPFSAKAAEAMRAYCDTPPQTQDRTSLIDRTGPWFCPDDGFRLNVAPGLLPACTSCQRVLPAVLIDLLVEPHVNHP